MPTSEPQQLLHISHAPQDGAWVQGTLIPALGLSTGMYRTREEDDPGAPKLAALGQAVRACRYTLLVASRAAAVNAWTTFAGEIAGQLGLEEGRPRLLVLALGFAPGSEDAKEILSLEQRALACFDCRDAERTPAALAALAATLALATRPPPPIECPYPGLRMFGEGDPATMFQRTDLFFGRDAEGRGLVDQLRATGRALVVGPSGCGKSSLVRARVLPTLTTGDHAMALVAARPGPAPERALRDAVGAIDPRLAAAVEAYLKDHDQPALVTAVGGPARLVYLDQLEEVFAASADARAEMFAWLAALGEVPGVAILLGMRADFYADLMRSPSWNSFKDHRVELAPLRGAGLREAITRPAEAVGVHVEVDLVERLVREAEADRAAEALPLLQVALEQLWAQRAWRYLSLDSYARLTGDESTDARRGLDVVFARHADATIERLAEPARVVARRVLIDLVYFGDGRPSTRRRRTVSELVREGDDRAALDRVIGDLAGQRLIVVSGDAGRLDAANVVGLGQQAGDEAAERDVDLAHDALITGWPALGLWIAERRDKLRIQRRLEARAEAGGEVIDTELAELVAWVAWLATPEGRAIGGSPRLLAMTERSIAARARRQRVRRGVVVTIACLTAVALVGGLVAWQARQAERTASDRAKDDRIASRGAQAAGLALQPGKAGDAAVLALDALGTGVRSGRPVSPLAIGGALAAAAPPRSMVHVRWPERVSNGIACSVDGEHAISVGAFGALTFPDRSGDSGTQLGKIGRYVSAARFAPDGTLLVANIDEVLRRDLATGKDTPVLSVPLNIFVLDVSGDGALLLVAGGTESDGKAELWRLTPSVARIAVLEGHQDLVAGGAFSSDGRYVATASLDGKARVFSTLDGALIAQTPPHQLIGKVSGVLGVAFSPLGQLVTAARWQLFLWAFADDAGAPGAREMTQVAQYPADVNRITLELSALTMSDDGRLLAAFRDGTVRSVALSDRAFRDEGIVVRRAAIKHAVRCGAGRILIAEVAGDLELIELAHDNSSAGLSIARDSISAIRYDTTGGALVVVHGEHIEVWDVALRRKMFDQAVPETKYRDAGLLVADDTLLAFNGSALDRWSRANGKQLPSWKFSNIARAGFSADGAQMAAQTNDGKLGVWSTRSGEQVQRFDLGPTAWPLMLLPPAFSGDGHRIAAIGAPPRNTDRTSPGAYFVDVWDLGGSVRLAHLEIGEGVSAVALNPDGTRLAVGLMTGDVEMFAISGVAQPLGRLVGHNAVVFGLVFSPDGRQLATGAADGEARIWDVSTQAPLGVLLGAKRDAFALAYSPDGATLAVGSFDGSVRLYPVTPRGVLGLLCDRSRDLPETAAARAEACPAGAP